MTTPTPDMPLDHLQPTVTTERGPLLEPDFHADWSGYAVVRCPAPARSTLMAEQVVALIGYNEDGVLVVRTRTHSVEIMVAAYPRSQVAPQQSRPVRQAADALRVAQELTLRAADAYLRLADDSVEIQIRQHSGPDQSPLTVSAVRGGRRS